MADTTTTSFGFTKPEPGGSNETWDTKLNANWDALDAELLAPVDGVVSLTGTTPNIDLEAGGEYRLTMSGNTTFTVSNPPANGFTTTKTLRITAGGAFSLTFWAGIEAIGGNIPAAPEGSDVKEYTLRASTVSGTTVYVLTETGIVA